MRKKFCFMAILAIYSFGALRVEAKNNPVQPAPLGTAVSNCGSGKPMWMGGTISHEQSRDVYRSIAESLDSVDLTPAKIINTEDLNRKLHQQIGEAPITCFLTLKPSGRIESLKFSEDHLRDLAEQQKAAKLLQSISYQKTAERGNITYKIELPTLIVTTTTPFK